MPTRYIDPKTDFGFKRIFGHEELLVSFLNTILPPPDRISRLEYLNTEVIGHGAAGRVVIYDLRCRTEDGRQIIVEFQRLPQPYFKERSLYYAMRGFEDQVKRGAPAYELSPVYLVAIVDYELPGNYNGYLHHFTLRDEQGALFSPILQLYFLELTKMPMIDEQTKLSALEQWAEAIRHMPALDGIPDWVTEEDLKKAFQVAEVAGMTDAERAKWERAFREDADLRGQVLQQYIYGKMQGEEKGLKKGREEGRQDGLEEGIRRALARGMSAEQAKQIWGLSDEDIARLNGK